MNALAAARPPTQVDERRTAAAVLVIGTGAAGLRAAIELAERGVQVLCVGKRRRDDAHTVLASGGINAALATMDPEDSWEQHAADTLRESYWLADPRAVELLCREAPEAIEDLVRYGAQFAREDDGRLTQRYFGARSSGRWSAEPPRWASRCATTSTSPVCSGTKAACSAPTASTSRMGAAG
jgi:succinate dehydrogenase / fumarate reductase flavoprotein subunit